MYFMKNKFKKINLAAFILLNIFYLNLISKATTKIETNISPQNINQNDLEQEEQRKENDTTMKNKEQSTRKNLELEKKLEKVRNEKTTTKKLILDLINKKLNPDQIVKKYYEMPVEVIGEILKNDKINKEKLNISKNQLDEINKIINKIKEKEVEFVEKFIELPKKENKDKPVVIINPGHGFEDSGAETKHENKTIEEKNLNAKISYKLAKLLLKQNFEIYFVFNLKYANISLPKDNPSLHVLFEERPPIRGLGDKGRMVDASAFCIREIIKKLKQNNKDAKIISVCLHHNSIPPSVKDNPFGFISFYRISENTSKNFEKNSKNLAEKFLKNCANVYEVKNGKDCSALKTEDWLVCGFGSKNEKKEKKFDDEAAVLLELGFITNKEELNNILDPKMNKKMAKALTKAICEYFSIEYNSK